MAVEGLLVRGRMDAVFAEPDGGWDVVDWKTGRRPPGAERRGCRRAAGGLPARLARSSPARRWTGSAPRSTTSGRGTVRPADLLDAEGLRALVARVPSGSP